MTNCIGSILHLEILPSSPRLWMDAWIVARECLTECSQTRLLLPGISLLSLLLLLLVTVCKKGSKTVEPISVPSVLKAAVCGIWRVSLMSSLLPGSHRQEVLCSQVPQRTQCNVFFIVFCLPAQSNAHPQKAVGRSGCLKNTPRIAFPSQVPVSLKGSHLSKSRWLLLRAKHIHTADSLFVQHVWILGCTQLVLSGALPQYSHYFLNPFCVLPTWGVVVTLQKSPPSLLATQWPGPLPMVDPWAPACLTLPNIL